MALYTIADLHLPLGIDKPMDIFGKAWENYVERLADNWQSVVKENDVVVLPGDFSWATYLEQSVKDFEYLHKLNGKKILLKGNHDYWDKLKPYLDHKTVIAHNAGFDVGALCATLEHFNIPFPTFDYLCTVKLSQKAYPELPSHKLNNLCDALGIHFHHHRAYDDAYACAAVMVRILEDYSLLNLDEVEECFEMEIGHLTPDTHLKCKKNKKKQKKNSKKAVNE